MICHVRSLNLISSYFKYDFSLYILFEVFILVKLPVLTTNYLLMKSFFKKSEKYFHLHFAYDSTNRTKDAKWNSQLANKQRNHFPKDRKNEAIFVRLSFC